MEEFSEASKDEEEEKEPRLTKAMRTRWAGRLMAPSAVGVPTVTPMMATSSSQIVITWGVKSKEKSQFWVPEEGKEKRRRRDDVDESLTNSSPKQERPSTSSIDHEDTRDGADDVHDIWKKRWAKRGQSPKRGLRKRCRGDVARVALRSYSLDKKKDH